MKKRIISLLLVLALSISMVAVFSGCDRGDNGSTGTSEKPDALVIMSDEIDGLFNPFYSTSAADGTIVSMTQIGMITSKYVKDPLTGKESVVPAFGDTEATVALDFAQTPNQDETETTFTFVLKNGIKFSDGHPLTMQDVLFNLYVYLDPAYYGSNTMYSTDIKGLAAYRTQSMTSGDVNEEERIEENAQARAQLRMQELVRVFETFKQGSGSYYATEEAMKQKIAEWALSDDYKSAISVDKGVEVTNEELLSDYNLTLKYFREEVEADYETSQSAYKDEPYKNYSQFNDPIFCFYFHENKVLVEYEWDEENERYDKTKFTKLTPLYDTNITTKEAAINDIYRTTVEESFNQIFAYWATGAKLLTEYTAEAKSAIIKENIPEEGMIVPNISGIVSLGHSDLKGTEITVNGNTYKIASDHNDDGTPKDGYDVLQITINGKDPKAQWNFAFSVAPQHIYGAGAKTGVNIEQNQFGVDFADDNFMSKIIQSYRNVKIPVGAGAYKATDRSNSDNPKEEDFFSAKIVYFKANNYFETVGEPGENGEGVYNAKIEKIRYQVVSANDALPMLERGAVHYITPQLTDENYDKLQQLASKNFNYILEDQLGYGYIGINASKVEDINIRKAIMCAMNTGLAVEFYRTGTASQVYYSMSKVSWAYPMGSNGLPSTDNDRDYPQIDETWIEQTAIDNIKKYMEAAGVGPGDSSLKYTFTIAGSSLTDHPSYEVFRDAAALLNSLGWDISVVPDTQALVKLTTGSLEVWAAAWGSTIDPDLYQVYHKNSNATSTKAWGYDGIKERGGEEMDILNDLSDKIDEARETLDQDYRAELYEEALKLILDLAVELPVYQRSVVYAYNASVIDKDSLPGENEKNPFSTPLDRIWSVEFAD